MLEFKRYPIFVQFNKIVFNITSRMFAGQMFRSFNPSSFLKCLRKIMCIRQNKIK